MGEEESKRREDTNPVVPTGTWGSFLYIPDENAKDHRTKALCPSRVEASETGILGNGGLTNLQASSIRKIPCCARIMGIFKGWTCVWFLTCKCPLWDSGGMFVELICSPWTKCFPCLQVQSACRMDAALKQTPSSSPWRQEQYQRGVHLESNLCCCSEGYYKVSKKHFCL